MTLGLFKCQVGGAVGFHPLELECHQAGDIFCFVIVEEWPLTEPRRLEAA